MIIRRLSSPISPKTAQIIRLLYPKKTTEYSPKLSLRLFARIVWIVCWNFLQPSESDSPCGSFKTFHAEHSNEQRDTRPFSAYNALFPAFFALFLLLFSLPNLLFSV